VTDFMPPIAKFGYWAKFDKYIMWVCIRIVIGCRAEIGQGAELWQSNYVGLLIELIGGVTYGGD
jgi:hypothetical protein